MPEWLQASVPAAGGSSPAPSCWPSNLAAVTRRRLTVQASSLPLEPRGGRGEPRSSPSPERGSRGEPHSSPSPERGDRGEPHSSPSPERGGRGEPHSNPSPERGGRGERCSAPHRALKPCRTGDRRDPAVADDRVYAASNEMRKTACITKTRNKENREGRVQIRWCSSFVLSKCRAFVILGAVAQGSPRSSSFPLSRPQDVPLLMAGAGRNWTALSLPAT